MTRAPRSQLDEVLDVLELAQVLGRELPKGTRELLELRERLEVLEVVRQAGHQSRKTTVRT